MLNRVKNKGFKAFGYLYFWLFIWPAARLRSPSFKGGVLQKVFQINTFEKVGGAAKIANHLHQSLARKGLKSNLLVSHILPVESEDVETLTPETSALQKQLLKFQELMQWPDFLQLASFGVVNNPKFQDADVLHLHNIHGGYFSPFALPNLTATKPTILTLHDSLMLFEDFEGRELIGEMNPHPDLHPQRLAFVREQLTRVYRNSHLNIVSPSQWLKSKIEQSILSGHPTHFIRNGVDHNVFSPQDKQKSRAELNLPTAGKIVLFVAYGGSDNGWKGGKYLKEAYEQLRADKNIYFVNLGGQGESDDPHWINTGHISEEAKMAKYYSAADVMLYPSLYDNCPLVVMESLSCGTPVVTFRTGGIPELVDHEKTGYIADYKSTAQLVTGVKLFLENESLRNSASHAARERALHDFTLDRMVAEYLILYKSLVEHA